MTENQIWVQNSKWLRTDDGHWINRDKINVVCVDQYATDNYAIIIYVNGHGKCILVHNFPDEKAAQDHLDKLQLFYELRPVAQSIPAASAE